MRIQISSIDNLKVSRSAKFEAVVRKLTPNIVKPKIFRKMMLTAEMILEMITGKRMTRKFIFYNQEFYK